MLNISIKKVVCLFLVAFTLIALVSCGDNDGSSTNDNGYSQQVDKQQGNDNDSNGKWGVTINGKSVELPCTLSELAKIGVNIYGEFDKETVLNSTNETFTMIAATCGEDTNPIHLKIVTGNDASKKEDNASVRIITNTKMDSSLFKLKGNIALGSSVDDVINIFGSDYNLSGATGDDIHNGYVVINYGTKANGAMFNFKDGILEYIEILADKGE